LKGALLLQDGGDLRGRKRIIKTNNNDIIKNSNNKKYFFFFLRFHRHVDSLRLCALVPLWLQKYVKQTQFSKSQKCRFLNQ
jgi:hypothetical protein